MVTANQPDSGAGGRLSFDFGGRRVLVTGGTSGIGAASARAFAAAGARVVISGRNVERGASLVRDGGAVVEFVAGDLTRREDCDRVVEAAHERLGGLDVVVNSAGVIYHATAEETSDEQWRQTMAVNVDGVFFVCRAALPRLKASRGTIVNIASDAALSGSYHLTAYCASKGAVLQMSRAMALDYARDGVRVVPICPGDVDTPMLRGEFRDRGLDAETGLRQSAGGVPLNRVCSAEEVAQMVLYAASDAAAFVTGYPLVLDGGSRA